MEMGSQTAPRRGQDPPARQPAAAGSRSSGLSAARTSTGTRVGRRGRPGRQRGPGGGCESGCGRRGKADRWWGRTPGAKASWRSPLRRYALRGRFPLWPTSTRPTMRRPVLASGGCFSGTGPGPFAVAPEIANEPVAGCATGEGECSEHQHGDDGCGPTRPDTPVAHGGGVDAVGTGRGWPAGGRLVGPPAAPGRPTGPGLTDPDAVAQGVAAKRVVGQVPRCSRSSSPASSSFLRWWLTVGWLRPMLSMRLVGCRA
jgi:hypothetical protein